MTVPQKYKPANYQSGLRVLPTLLSSYTKWCAYGAGRAPTIRGRFQ